MSRESFLFWIRAGRIYWWGILPYSQRKKLLEKSKCSLVQSADKDGGSGTKLPVSERKALVSAANIACRLYTALIA